MSKIKFDYDIEKDAWWWARIAQYEDLFGMDWKAETAPIPDKLIKKINSVKSDKAQKLTLDYLKKRPSQKRIEEAIKYEIKGLGPYWSKIEEEFFSKLEQLFEGRMYRREFTGYFTSLTMCPYNYDEHWFMISVWKSLPFQIKTIMHEVMHLQFISQYYEYITDDRGLSEDKFEEIKESVATILDEKMFDRFKQIEERAYPDFEKTTSWVKKMRDKDKSLEKIVDKFCKNNQANT